MPRQVAGASGAPTLPPLPLGHIMLNSLFRRLTADPRRGAKLFDAVTAVARRPAWYLAGKVPDTIDGRFAVLATVTALVMTRLERDGRDGDLVSVALTERFVEVMEAEHRELGLGDPSLGKQVRKLVGALARRAELWRATLADEHEWAAATRESLYQDDPGGDAVRSAADMVRTFWEGLQTLGLPEIQEGAIG